MGEADQNTIRRVFIKTAAINHKISYYLPSPPKPSLKPSVIESKMSGIA